MMENQHEDRVKYINDLSKVIEDATSLVGGFLFGLGWTRDKVLDDDKELATCPFDKSHKVQPAKLDEHMKGCQLKAAGLHNLSAKDLPMSSEFFYQSPSSSVAQVILDKSQLDSLGIAMKRIIAKNELGQINESKGDGWGITHSKTESYFHGFPIKTSVSLAKVKSTHDDSEKVLFELPVEYLETMLGVDDRLKLYEHVLQKSKSEQKTHAVTYDELEQEASEQLKVLEMQEKEDSDRPKSKVEAMAELRDYKRRRQSYRAKTISQSKRPAVEVIRELIDQQMKYLEIISGKHPDVDEEGDKESEQKFESLRDAVETSVGEMEEVSSRVLIEEKLSERCHSDSSTKARSMNRYGMNEVGEWRRQDRNREARYGRWDSLNRDDGERHGESDRKRYRDRAGERDKERDRERERDRDRDRYREHGRSRYRESQSQRDGSRDLGRNRDRNKDRRSKSKERNSSRDKGDINRLNHESFGNGRDSELNTRRETVRDSPALRLDQAGKNVEGMLSDKRTNDYKEQALERKMSISASEAESIVKERLKALRTGSEDVDRGSEQVDPAYGNEEDSEELNENGSRRKSEKRSRSSSGSLHERTSGSRERHKNKKHKHKKKKKKSKKTKEDTDYKSGDEWVEKNEVA